MYINIYIYMYTYIYIYLYIHQTDSYLIQVMSERPSSRHIAASAPLRPGRDVRTLNPAP